MLLLEKPARPADKAQESVKKLAAGYSQVTNLVLDFALSHIDESESKTQGFIRVIWTVFTRKT